MRAAGHGDRSSATDALTGIGAGLIATVVMTGVIEGAQRLGLLGDMPPWIITKRTLQKGGVDRQTPHPVDRVIASIAHLGFGAAAGAVFAAADDELALPGPRALRGVAYAAAIWAISYGGWIPLLGLMPPPHRDQPGRPVTMLAAHAVFGAVLAGSLDALEDR